MFASSSGCFSWTSHGDGIPSSEMPHLFEPFFRGDRARAAQIQGSGLGLSVAHGIMRDHQGRVEVESTPQKGTTVRIELPLAAELVLRNLVIRIGHPREVVHVLLVEDHVPKGGGLAFPFEKGTALERLSKKITRPQGKLTLTMSANPTVKSELLHYLEVLKQAA